jgi:tetratricopeptide (TPR) repeat protein
LLLKRLSKEIRMKIKALIILLISFNAVSLFADHNRYLFEQANQLYEKNQYNEAVQKYEEIVHNGYSSWEVYYNLGNAYYKNEQLGKAIANYERALRLESKNEDLKFNLELANSRIVDEIPVPDEFIVFKIFSIVKNSLALNALTIITILCYLFLMTGLTLRILIKTTFVQRLSGVLIAIFVVLFIFSSSLLAIRIYEHINLKFGIVIASQANVMNSPEETGSEAFMLHEGCKVQVQQQSSDWLQIRLSDGKVGWIKNEAVEII